MFTAPPPGRGLALLMHDVTAVLTGANGPARILWIGSSLALLLSAAIGAWSFRRRRRHWREAVVDGARVLVAPTDQWADLPDAAPFFASQEASLGLNADSMQSCLLSGRGAGYVAADLAREKALGAGSTPSFYVDQDRLFNGVPTIADLRAKLDSVYAVKSGKVGAAPSRTAGSGRR